MANEPYSMPRRKPLWIVVLLAICAGIAINVWYFQAIANTSLPMWMKFLLLHH